MGKKYSKKVGDTVRQHNLCEIIRVLMQERRLDDMSLSEATGVALTSLSRMKNDPSANPTIASLQPVADYFGLTISQLIGETSLNKAYTVKPQKNQRMTIKQVPVIAWDLITPFLEGELTDFSQWVPTSHSLGDQVFALTVPSPNWGKLFVQGACVIFDKGAQAQDNDYALIYSAATKQHFVKQVIVEGAELYLKSLNTEINVTQPMKADESIQAKVAEVRVLL